MHCTDLKTNYTKIIKKKMKSMDNPERANFEIIDVNLSWNLKLHYILILSHKP